MQPKILQKGQKIHKKNRKSKNYKKTRNSKNHKKTRNSKKPQKAGASELSKTVLEKKPGLHKWPGLDIIQRTIDHWIELKKTLASIAQICATLNLESDPFKFLKHNFEDGWKMYNSLIASQIWTVMFIGIQTKKPVQLNAAFFDQILTHPTRLVHESEWGGAC